MYRLLVVDDESIERNTLRDILSENMGHEVQVRTAADGASAVEIAAIWHADVVMMDIEMPGMNGIQAAGAIKRSLPDCQILFLTAYGRFDYAQEAIRLSACDYLLKPAEDEEILAAVRKAIGLIPEPMPLAKPEPTGAEHAAPADKNARLMAQVDEYLHKNYRQDISLEGLAATLSFSPYYLSKLFKQHFEVTFVEYLADIRMEKAKELLNDLTRSAKEIGELVGYPNSNYFVKLFKKKTGLTPTEYRAGL